MNVDLTGTDYAGITGGTTLRTWAQLHLAAPSNFIAQYNSIIDNRSLFEITSDNDFQAINGGGTFLNTGILIKSGGLDVSSFSSQWKVNNNNGGVIKVASGELEFSTLENAQNGIIQGVGSIDVPTNFTNNGITAPGNSCRCAFIYWQFSSFCYSSP